MSVWWTCMTTTTTNDTEVMRRKKWEKNVTNNLASMVGKVVQSCQDHDSVNITVQKKLDDIIEK